MPLIIYIKFNPAVLGVTEPGLPVVAPKKYAFKAWWATSLTKKPFLAMSSDNKEAYSFGNFKHKFTFTQVILYFFFADSRN